MNAPPPLRPIALRRFKRLALNRHNLLAEYRRTTSASAIGRRLGVSRNTVVRRLREIGLRNFDRNAAQSLQSLNKLKAIAEAKRAGHTTAEICVSFRCHHMTVYAACKRHKVSLRLAANPVRPPKSKSIAAYAAGLVDGEGCIQITRQRQSYVLRVDIRMTEPDGMAQIAKQIGGTFKGPYPPRRPNEKPQWYWCVSCRQAAAFLRIVKPFLIVKRRQAEIAIAFQNTRRCGKSKSTKPGGQFRQAIIAERKRYAAPSGGTATSRKSTS